MNQLVVVEKKEPNYILYELNGAFTFDTFDDFRTVLYQKVVKGHVVLDLSEISAIDSSCIGLLFAANRDAEKSDHVLYLLNPSDCVVKQLEETGLADIINQITSIVEIS